MNETSSNPQTLLELLNEYNVEIPIIQRDYAQGRTDKITAFVRTTLLHDMKKAVLPNANNPLDLGFVYGKNDNVDKITKFIPIDGQQRLTTLFLLHLYVFRDDASKNEMLIKFTYKTRLSSNDFLEALVKNRKEVFVSDKKPSDEIKDSAWFVTSWRHDPTIQSVLVMLDDIQTTFGDVPDLDRNLIDSKPLVFKFLDMDYLGMEDGLYIKLNARGRPLTSFETFKARLLGRLNALESEKEQPLPFTNKEFEELFDREWTDLFWKQSETKFDRVFLAFFVELLVNKGICVNKENDDDDTNDWINLLNNVDYNKIDKEYYETVYCTLNFLNQKKECQEIAEYQKIYDVVFSELGKEKGKRTFRHKTMFHAVVAYLYKAKGIVTDLTSLRQWLRIIQNLTYNSSLEDKTYRNVVENINEISEYWNNLLVYFGTSEKIQCRESGFSTEQLEEEQIKARLIIKNSGFDNEIYKAEEHEYFRGQIRSALYLAGQNDDYDKDIFIDYWNKISLLFDKDKPRCGEDRHLLRRALLSFGDYTLPVGQYYTLCTNSWTSNTTRTTSLKYLFSYDNHKRSEIIRDFLNRLSIDKNMKINEKSIEDMQNQLQEIINQSTVLKNDWRYCFIQFPYLLTLMNAEAMRLRKINNQFVIVPKFSSSGYNYDVFLSALYEFMKELHGVQAEFGGDRGTDAERYLRIKNYRVTFAMGKFIIHDETNVTPDRETGMEYPLSDALSILIGS